MAIDRFADGRPAQRQFRMSSKRVGAPPVIIRRTCSGWSFWNGRRIVDGTVSFYASEQATTGKVLDGRRQSVAGRCIIVGRPSPSTGVRPPRVRAGRQVLWGQRSLS